MKPRIFISVVVSVAAFILGGLAIADSETNNFRASLDGYHETPLSISTNATGSFRARLNPAGDQLTYEFRTRDWKGGYPLRARSHRTDGDLGRSDVLPLRWPSTCVPEWRGNGHRNRDCGQHYWASRSRRCRRRVPGGNCRDARRGHLRECSYRFVYARRNSRTDQRRAILARFCSISLTSIR